MTGGLAMGVSGVVVAACGVKDFVQILNAIGGGADGAETPVVAGSTEAGVEEVN